MTRETTTNLEITSEEIKTREVATTTDYSKKKEDYDEEEMCWLTL